MISALFGILKAALSAVFRIVALVCKLVYRILRALHIRLLALYVLVCAVCAIFFPVFTDGIAYFWAGFGLCAAVTLVSWILAARRALSAKPRRLPQEAEETAAAEAPAEKRQERQPEQPPAPRPVRYPRYFDVEGQPAYFFAEYADRYELYRREEGGAVYVRTDKKTDLNGE